MYNFQTLASTFVYDHDKNLYLEILAFKNFLGLYVDT